jgi:hypothetical protein
MVLPHSSTQKYLFTLGGQFVAARGGQYDRLLQHSSINDLTPKEFIILHENTPETLISLV